MRKQNAATIAFILLALVQLNAQKKDAIAPLKEKMISEFYDKILVGT